MKIYTKKGDQGTTSLLGGNRVPKHHARIDAYGQVDELNSWIGYLRDELNENHSQAMLKIQDRLFTIGSLLALDPSHEGKMRLPELKEKDIVWLEEQMDEMDKHLPEMRNFVLPGGHPSVSKLHIARCVCRRAERAITFLAEQESVSALIMAYLNRLSDYLFVLSRKVTIETGATEIPWIPEQ